MRYWRQSLACGRLRPGWLRCPVGQNRDYLIVHAEIYPSLLPIQPTAGEVKDAAQVRTMASHFAALDDAGRTLRLVRRPDMPYARRPGQD